MEEDAQKMTDEEKENELYFERQANSNDSGLPTELVEVENRYQSLQKRNEKVTVANGSAMLRPSNI